MADLGDIERRLAALEQQLSQPLDLSQIPLAALIRALQLRWSIDSSALSADTIQKFLQLAVPGDHKVAIGHATLNFIAGGFASSVSVSHDLKATPLLIVPCQNGAGGPSPVCLQVDTITNASFRIYGEFRTGTAAGAVGVNVGWLAII